MEKEKRSKVTWSQEEREEMARRVIKERKDGVMLEFLPLLRCVMPKNRERTILQLSKVQDIYDMCGQYADPPRKKVPQAETINTAAVEQRATDIASIASLSWSEWLACGRMLLQAFVISIEDVRSKQGAQDASPAASPAQAG